jgi:DNA-binding phage protein
MCHFESRIHDIPPLPGFDPVEQLTTPEKIAIYLEVFRDESDERVLRSVMDDVVQALRGGRFAAWRVQA